MDIFQFLLQSTRQRITDDGTYTVTADSKSKNYTGSKTVKADGKAEEEKPDAPMISSVKVVGNKATAILSGDSEGAAGYDYVISTDRDCITNKDYDSVNKNQVQTSTTFKYVQQGTYYAYCHAWKRDANGKKVFSDWSNAYPFVVSAITPDAPVITNVNSKRIYYQSNIQSSCKCNWLRRSTWNRFQERKR